MYEFRTFTRLQHDDDIAHSFIASFVGGTLYPCCIAIECIPASFIVPSFMTVNSYQVDT